MFNEIKRTIKTGNKVTLFYAFASILPVVGFLPNLPVFMVYAVAIFYGCFCLLKMRNVDGLTAALLIYIPIELMIVQPPPLFRSWPRYVLFAFLLMSVSPLLQSDRLRNYRKQIFQYVMWACVGLGVGSFFARFLGLNFMKAAGDEFVFRTGLFGGLTTHSMMLGPIAGIGTCYLVYSALLTKNRLCWLFAAMSLFAVMFSASRSALFATLVGVVVTIYYLSGTKSNFVKYLVLAIIIGSSTFTLWQDALSGVIEKNSQFERMTDSRMDLWETRLDEFQSSPIFGVGFCASSFSESSIVDISSGRVETGTSWLIILSMLGIIGAFTTVPILFRAFKYSRLRGDRMGALLCGVLTLFFVHMFAEGYIFAGGSFLAFMLWLTVGVATDSKYCGR